MNRRRGERRGRLRDVLGAGLDARQQAMLEFALSFFTWRTLTRDAGLSGGEAVAAMVQAITAGERA